MSSGCVGKSPGTSKGQLNFRRPGLLSGRLPLVGVVIHLPPLAFAKVGWARDRGLLSAYRWPPREHWTPIVGKGLRRAVPWLVPRA